MGDSELIVLLDEQHRPIGSAPKLASHTLHTPLHLAFSCYIFNRDGKLLITRRAASKKVWPDVWTNTVCGHPAPGESLQHAIVRRAAFELGIDDLTEITTILPEYRYRTPPCNGIIENEFCPVFFAKSERDPACNPDEVSDYRWISPSDLRAEISQHPDMFSYWLMDQLKQLGNTL